MSAEVRDFLSWFDGFQENIRQRPSADQWKKLVERIKKIELPAAPIAPAAKPANLKSVLSEAVTANDPRFTPETLPKGQSMSAGPR